jgi:hypothetical protein
LLERIRLGQRPGNVASFLVDTARDFADGRLWTALCLEQATTTVARFCPIEKCLPVVDQLARRREDLVRRADIYVTVLVEREAARSAGMEVEAIMIRPELPLEAVFKGLTDKRVDGLVVQGSIVRKEILDLAMKHRLPTVTSIRLGPSLGALMSYGSDYFALARQSAVYVDKILKGAKPADLPVAFPTKFLLIINATTAKALGINISPMMLGRADEVIE